MISKKSTEIEERVGIHFISINGSTHTSRDQFNSVGGVSITDDAINLLSDGKIN